MNDNWDEMVRVLLVDLQSWFCRERMWKARLLARLVQECDMDRLDCNEIRADLIRKRIRSAEDILGMWRNRRYVGDLIKRNAKDTPDLLDARGISSGPESVETIRKLRDGWSDQG